MSFKPAQKLLSKAMPAALALSQAFLRIPDAQRTVPSRLGVTTQTFLNWIEGKSAPSADNLINAMAEFDEVHDAVMEAAHRKPAGLSRTQTRKLLEVLKEME